MKPGVFMVVIPLLTSCQSQRHMAEFAPVYVPNLEFDYIDPISTPPTLPIEFSQLTYEAPAPLLDPDEAQSEMVRYVPTFALPAFGGYLMGGDRGEWGGELVFLGPDGKSQMLLNANVHGIFEMPFGIVVFSGLAHMSWNEGSIYLIDKTDDETVSAALWRKLPGAPRDVSRTSTGDLVFRVFGGKYEKRGKSIAAWPILDCYLLRKSGEISSMPCSSIVAARI